MTHPFRLRFSTACLLFGLLAWLVPAVSEAKPLRRTPKRLSSVGDSITEAINAEEFNPFVVITRNHWASWANGYRGFWEWLFGRTNVNSHNQRITARYGSSGRKNYLEARSGADSYDLAPQMAQSVSHAADYVAVLMGHNDVCQDDFADIPTDAEFETNLRSGFERLRQGLPPGATIYTLGIVDIYKLWQLGDQLESFGILDCRVIWATTLFGVFPCGTMLSPLNSEADRQYTRSRNVAFNDILRRVASEYEAGDPNHYWQFSDTTFQVQFSAREVSPFDCFHPSAAGQTRISSESWAAGPFR